MWLRLFGWNIEMDFDITKDDYQFSLLVQILHKCVSNFPKDFISWNDANEVVGINKWNAYGGETSYSYYVTSTITSLAFIRVPDKVLHGSLFNACDISFNRTEKYFYECRTVTVGEKVLNEI